MLIEEEIVDYISSRISTRGTATADRDSLIVTYYYGFGEASWPTYDYLADHFGIGSRERVRQIINERFRDHASIEALPICRAVASFLDETTFFIGKDILGSLLSQRLIDGHVGLRGLLNLMHDLGQCSQFDLYQPNLERADRAGSEALGLEVLMLAPSRIAPLRESLRIARKLPGRLGMVKMDDLRSELFDTGLQEHFKPLREILRISNDATCSNIADVEWYAVDDRANTLQNYVSKMRSQSEECDLILCCEILSNALRAVANKYVYPGPQEIATYLSNQEGVIVSGSVVQFVGAASQPTPVELAACEYLRRHGAAHFPEIKSYLESLGYGLPSIQKAVSTSPVIWVDKSNGRGSYQYKPIPTRASTHSENSTNVRYGEFRIRLQKLLKSGTDANIEATARREQGVLREWLFGNAASAACAFCGRVFQVDSLVAAHKKPRSLCMKMERTDPFIVMPLCKFGCDYTYEVGLLSVSADGVIVRGANLGGDTEAALVRPLLGSRIPSTWLRGSPSYFRMHL